MVEIGAMARLSELAAHQAIPELLQHLTQREGPNTLRNVATLGGTVATGNPDSELVAGLLVFDGRVTLAKAGPVNETVALGELLADRSLLDGSIIVAVGIETDGQAAVARTGRTPSDTSIVAAVGRRTASGIRLALTGIAATPTLVESDAVADLDPPGDFRGSSEYRRQLAGTLTRRVMEELGEKS